MDFLKEAEINNLLVYLGEESTETTIKQTYPSKTKHSHIHLPP